MHWSYYKQLKKEMQKECRKSYNEYMSNIIHESYENGKKKNFLAILYHYKLIFVVQILYRKTESCTPKIKRRLTY